MENMRKLLLLVTLLCLFSQISKAQNVAVKTNGLYWGIAAPNAGVEFATGRKMTMELFGAIDHGRSGIRMHDSGWFNQSCVIGFVNLMRVISSAFISTVHNTMPLFETKYMTAIWLAED